MRIRSYFFTPPPQPSIFPNTPELKELSSKIFELYTQERTLTKDAKNNPTKPVSYIKSRVFSSTLLSIHQAVVEFNEQERINDRKQQIKFILFFVTKLKNIIEHSLNLNKEILNQPRNDDKEITKNVLNASITVGSCFIGYMTYSPLFFVTTALASYNLNHDIQHLTSLDDTRTTSVRLFEEIIEQLKNIKCSMKFALKQEENAEVLRLGYDMPIPPDDASYLLIGNNAERDEEEEEIPRRAVLPSAPFL